MTALRKPPSGSAPVADRKAVFARDRGICCECHQFDAKWELEHSKALWMVDRDAPDARGHWALDAVTTMCRSCHARKTAAEATMRAKEARIRAKAAGIDKRKWRRKLPSRPFSTAHRPLRRKE